VAWRWSHLPESARRKLLAEGQQEDVPRRYGCHPVSAGPRRPSGSGGSTLEAPKTKVLADKFKAMNLSSSVMVIAEEIDENLYLASRNLKNVFVVEPRYADRVAGALQESARHQGCDRQTQGDVRMSTTKFDEGRLMQVLVAPIVSEKATWLLKSPML
jgi:hypothetical protein